MLRLAPSTTRTWEVGNKHPPWAEMEKFKVTEGTEGRPTSKSTAQAYSRRKIYSPLNMVPPTMVACQRMAPW